METRKPQKALNFQQICNMRFIYTQGGHRLTP
jgi:hypothetical protein